MIATFLRHRLLNPISHSKLSKNICIFAKNWYLFGLDIGKINICDEKMESRCHLKIRVFFSSWMRWLIEEFWHFTTHENGAILEASVHDSVRILPFLSEAKRGGLKEKNEMCAIRLTTQERDFLMDVWQHPTSSRSLKKRPRLSISRVFVRPGFTKPDQ